jgi:hypothetical protein
MTNKILRVAVTDVHIGALTLEGLMLSDGKFMITVQQVASLLSVPQKNAQRTFNGLLGESFQFLKVQANRSTRQNRPENAMDLTSFRILVRKLDRKGNEVAGLIVDAFTEVALEQIWADAFGVSLTSEGRQKTLSRILDAPNPWEKMFEVSFCRKVYSWMGGRFYWVYLYDFLTPEERCKVDRLNPIDPVTGKRDDRIHQYFDDQMRDRLYRHAQRVTDLVDTSTGFQDFATRFARFSGNNQLHLF